jgi:hypothetical protein
MCLTAAWRSQKILANVLANAIRKALELVGAIDRSAAPTARLQTHHMTDLTPNRY